MVNMTSTNHSDGQMELAASNMWIQAAKFGTHHGKIYVSNAMFVWEYQAGYLVTGTCFFLFFVWEWKIIPSDELSP